MSSQRQPVTRVAGARRFALAGAAAAVRRCCRACLLFLALIGNAAICGVVSGSNDRFQARLVWLAELTVLWCISD
jgi:hypothetical protein